LKACGAAGSAGIKFQQNKIGPTLRPREASLHQTAKGQSLPILFGVSLNRPGRLEPKSATTCQLTGLANRFPWGCVSALTGLVGNRFNRRPGGPFCDPALSRLKEPAYDASLNRFQGRAIEISEKAARPLALAKTSFNDSFR